MKQSKRKTNLKASSQRGYGRLLIGVAVVVFLIFTWFVTQNKMVLGLFGIGQVNIAQSSPIPTVTVVVTELQESPTPTVEQLLTTETPTPTTSVISSPTTKPTSTPKATATPTPKPTTTHTPTPTNTPTTTATPTPSPTVDYSKPWTVGLNCPQTTQKCVPCTTGSYCRFEPGKTHGFEGWSCQNNNPGNIRNSSTNMSTDFKNKLIVKYGGVAACGVRYDKRGGSYFVFSTYTNGYEGLKAYLKAINAGEHSAYAGTGWKCGDCTLTQFFSKYAPNDSTYDDIVASEIGELQTQKLSFIVANKLNRMADAIKKHEGFFVQ